MSSQRERSIHRSAKSRPKCHVSRSDHGRDPTLLFGFTSLSAASSSNHSKQVQRSKERLFKIPAPLDQDTNSPNPNVTKIRGSGTFASLTHQMHQRAPPSCPTSPKSTLLVACQRPDYPFKIGSLYTLLRPCFPYQSSSEGPISSEGTVLMQTLLFESVSPDSRPRPPESFGSSELF